MNDKAAPSVEALDDSLMSVADLRTYVKERDAAQASRAVDAMSRAEKARKAYIERLSQRIDITDERLRRLLQNAKAAVERGEREILIGRFPVDICTDHGRAINNSEPDWPNTLTGLPQQVYEVWKEKLQPLGYRLKALIIEWPQGLPGEAGMFLTWPELRDR